MRTTGTQTYVKERRSSVRENVSIPAKLAFENKSLDVTIVDLSERGLAVRSSSTLAGGTCVEIQMSLPGSSGAVQCNGIVAWSTKEMSGIEFSFVTATVAEAIEKWLDRQSSGRK